MMFKQSLRKMKIAVITPYYSESEDVLIRCIKSVQAQTVPCLHYMIADKERTTWFEGAGVHRNLALGVSHQDCGNTPRGIGALLALSEGADAITFLDADNTYDPDHIEVCLALAGSEVDYVVAKRRIALSDGTPVPCPEEPGHVDTSCFFLFPAAFFTLPQWVLQPAPLAELDDRLYNMLLKQQKLRCLTTHKPTVTYTSRWALHYNMAGRTPPPDAKETAGSVSDKWWGTLSQPERKMYAQRMSLPGLNVKA
jgi:hypothetical protein